MLTKALVDKAASVFDVYGADAWYERPIEEFVPDGMTCAECGGTEFEREYNILDVWFDSGSSHEAVLPFREDHHWPADIYLEGSDQHRGWFHSSLLVGIGTRGRAPFNQVLTHGFVMDEHGRKMSKSLGNTTAPQDVIKQSGSEILRLWVTMVDYRYDINLGKEVLARTVESYRKFRNVIRVLVANLYDFDPKDDAVPKAKMLEIDRWVLAKYADAAEKIVKAYDDYDYPAIFQVANQLITVDLSAFYVDVTKDRMYTFGAKSEARRSGQTAMFIIVDGLARLLAPVLSVTMDELWRMLPGEREESVHMALFPRDLDQWKDAALLERWSALAAVRDQVNLQLEEKRKDKTIAANLSARVVIEAGGETATLLNDYRDFLPTLFGVSEVELKAAGRKTARPRRPSAVDRATGTKCDRCWRYVPEVSAEPDRTGLCPRCVEALAEPVSLVRARVAPPRSHRRRHGGDPRSDHQGDGPSGPGAAREHRGDSRLSRSDARAQHRRRVRDAERGGLSVQDGRAVAGGGDRARRRRVVRCDGAAERSAGARRHRRRARRRDRQPDRSRDQRLRAGFRRCLLERLAFLGVQRRRRRDHGWRDLHDSRYPWAR